MTDALPTTVRLRLAGDGAVLDRISARLRTRVGFTVARRGDALLVDVPLARIERAGASVEAIAVAAGVELWIDALDARVPAAALDSYGSRIWPALGDAVVRNELAVDRGDEPDTDLFTFIRVVEHDGQRFVENARASWDPPTTPPGPDYGPSHWTDIPTQGEIEAAVGPEIGIVFVELHPDRAPTISRAPVRHEDPELEAMLPSPAPGEHWDHLESVRDPADRRFRRGLRELGVDRRATSEAFALHGSGPDVVSFRLSRVPGAAADDLVRVFTTTVLGFKRYPWQPETVAGLPVFVARQPIDGQEDFGVLVATDGLVATIGGPRPTVERVLVELMATWGLAPGRSD